MKKLIALFLILTTSTSFTVTYSQITEEERNTIIEAIEEVEFEKFEMSVDHLHLRGKILSMIKDSKFDDLLEIFNQKDFSRSGKITYRNNVWEGVDEFESSEEFLSFLKDIHSTLPAKIKLEPTKIKEDVLFGDHSIVELYEYVNTKGEKMELFVQFFNGQINIISCRFYYKS